MANQLTLEQLKARRGPLVTQLREVEAEADPDTYKLPPELEEKFATLKAALESLDAMIERSEVTRRLERRAPSRPLDGSPETRATVRFGGRDAGLPNSFDGRVLTAQSGDRVPVLEARHKLADFSEERAAISFGGFLRALYFGPRDDLERRALAESTIGQGGALVPTPLALQVIDLLRSQCVAFKAGATTVPMESQTLRFARQIADPVGGWRAEGAPVVEGTPAFDGVTLTAKSWALLVKVSRELLEDGQNLDAVLQTVFARVAALALDRAILYGDGTNNSPVGIANTPGIQVSSLGVNGGQLTSRAALLDAVLALELANAPNVTAMVMSPRSARTLNGLTDTLGQPLRPPPSLEGVPILTTTSASVTETQGTATNASSILLGDFGQVVVGMRTALQITVLQERYLADSGQIGFVLWMRADVLLQHPAALARIDGIVP